MITRYTFKYIMSFYTLVYTKKQNIILLLACAFSLSQLQLSKQSRNQSMTSICVVLNVVISSFCGFFQPDLHPLHSLSESICSAQTSDSNIYLARIRVQCRLALCSQETWCGGSLLATGPAGSVCLVGWGLSWLSSTRLAPISMHYTSVISPICPLNPPPGLSNRPLPLYSVPGRHAAMSCSGDGLL